MCAAKVWMSSKRTSTLWHRGCNGIKFQPDWSIQGSFQRQGLDLSCSRATQCHCGLQTQSWTRVHRYQLLVEFHSYEFLKLRNQLDAACFVVVVVVVVVVVCVCVCVCVCVSVSVCVCVFWSGFFGHSMYINNELHLDGRESARLEGLSCYCREEGLRMCVGKGGGKDFCCITDTVYCSYWVRTALWTIVDIHTNRRWAENVTNGKILVLTTRPQRTMPSTRLHRTILVITGKVLQRCQRSP